MRRVVRAALACAAVSSVGVAALAVPAAAARSTAATSAGGGGERADAPAGPPAVAAAQAPPVAATVSVQGRGFGHGRGMGQWGALGYAVNLGWTHGQILDRYYGGTRAGTVDPNSVMTVRLIDFDDREAIVWSETGRLVTNATGEARFRALWAQETANNTYDLWTAADCGGGPGGWTRVARGVTGPVTFAAADTPDDTTNLPDLLAACRPDGSIRYYRGQLRAVNDTDGSNHLVNVTTIERYLRGVVPRESPASWADQGNGRGREALRSQAVAARSYSFSENRYPYAKTCDTQSCQVYGGAGLRASATAPLQALEDRRTDQAIADTAGQVRLMADGSVARTEYSSSTGGWTAGGTFPAVQDEGDAIASNPNQTWRMDVPVAAVVGQFPQLGELRGIDVTRRNGLGELGGRAVTVVLRGSLASVTLTGEQARRALGVRSDWFVVPPGFTSAPAVGLAPVGPGYVVVGRDGQVVNVNGAPFRGSLAGARLNAPIVGVTSAGLGTTGYWLLGADGGVFSYGAPFFGSTGGLPLNAPIVAMAARPQGDGYWFVARDGGVFAYGAAAFHGSMGGQFLAQPVVGMAPTPSGDGYWLVASDGGIFSYGDARFFGSTGAMRLNQPIVGMAARPQGDGYWFVARDGGVFAFGAARFLGGLGGTRLTSPIVAMSASTSGNGYRLLAADGTVYPFGDA